MKTVLSLLLIYFQQISSSELDPEKFLVYGPGLDASITLPARYFFIQLIDKNQQNVTEFNKLVSAKFIDLSFHILPSGRLEYLRHDVLYLNDGSFLIRYQIHQSIIHFNIAITLLWIPTSTYIGKKSFILKKPIYSEKCHCPQFSLSKWLSNTLKCSPSYSQINKDFLEFPIIDVDESFNRFYERYYPFTSVATCRYKIKSNRIYRKCFGNHTDFKMFSDASLLSLSHKTKLPDTDFLFNLGDWPLSEMNGERFAIFSWCGSNDTNDIVIPSYETMEWVLEMMGRVYLDIFTMLSDCSHGWKGKIEKAFWRGRDSSHARLNLARLSLKHSSVLDAKLTNMFFFPNDSSLGQLTHQIPFTDFFQYKYIINMDGTVAAYRFPLSLVGGSVILKEESKYYEYIYSQLLPGRHYIPIKTDLSDLIEKIIWSKSHDSESRHISENARNFIKSKFTPIDIYCYFGRVLEKYSSLVRKSFEIIIPNDYELVTDESEERNCDCFVSSYHEDL